MPRPSTSYSPTEWKTSSHHQPLSLKSKFQPPLFSSKNQVSNYIIGVTVCQCTEAIKEVYDELISTSFLIYENQMSLPKDILGDILRRRSGGDYSERDILRNPRGDSAPQHQPSQQPLHHHYTERCLIKTCPRLEKTPEQCEIFPRNISPRECEHPCRWLPPTTTNVLETKWTSSSPSSSHSHPS